MIMIYYGEMMSDLVFLFDLDSTITKKEILPTISEKFKVSKELQSITEKTMSGEIPFKQSFLKRVDLLKGLPVNQVRECIRDIETNELLVEFIREYKERCYIVTGNLDVWIEGLVHRIGMQNHLFCSKGIVTDGKLSQVSIVLDKGSVIQQMNVPYVAVGDGNNDAEMIGNAKIGIGYGGVRTIAPAVLDCATHAFYDEMKLVEFLRRLV